MKIAWFVPRYAPCIGGAENYSREMVRRFVADGHRVDVLTSDAQELAYFTHRDRGRIERPAEERIDGALVRRFPVRHLPFQRYAKKLLSYAPHWSVRCRVAPYLPFLQGIERVRDDYDLVFAVGFPFTLFSFAALRSARAARAPLILTPFLHLATPGDEVSRNYTRPHQVRLLAEAEVVVVATELEARAVEGWGIPRARLLHLPMALDHETVTGGDGARFRNKYAIPTSRALVGQLGVLDPNKGTCDLVRAVARLNEARPAREAVHLVLAGTPTPEFQRFAREMPSAGAEWLTITGPLPTAEVPDFYDALDVFAMPSRTDSFGIVFLEAWANAKPVVAAAAGGVVEVVRHDENGLLVAFGDTPGLCEAIRDLLDDRGKARRLGLTGRAMVSLGYTWDDRFATLRDQVRAKTAGASSGINARLRGRKPRAA